ncbi:MAG: glycosyltransferase [Candidatus Competibacteraceae bacterium]|nr:glycosyltransferase [Candidatus Competibacteraceae bacterium]
MSETATNPKAGCNSCLPLVSIIIRSMGRPSLLDTLNSVASQTYDTIEVVVVDAKGSGHPELESACGEFPLRMIGAERPLARATAANLGLSHAKGRYLLFLDDDDLLLPDHIGKLVNAFLDGHDSLAAYTGVRLENAAGATLKILDDPYDPARLRGANFLPIHAVLFDCALVEMGCRFDEELECLEDWDFWLQVSQHTLLHHVPGVSAIYRFSLGDSGLSAQSVPEKHLINRAAVFAKWQNRFIPREWVEAFFWFERARDHYLQWVRALENEVCARDAGLAQLEQEIRARDAGLAQLQQEIRARDVGLAQLEQEIRARDIGLAQLEDEIRVRDVGLATLEADMVVLTAEVNRYRQQVQALLSSTSWKLTAPIRWIRQRLPHRND